MASRRALSHVVSALRANKDLVHARYHQPRSQLPAHLGSWVQPARPISSNNCLAANAAQAVGKASEEQAEHPAAKPVAKPAPAVTGSTAAEARIRGHAAESEVVAKAPLESSRAASQMERGFQGGLPPSPSVVVIDTLELLRGFERAGFSAQQAEAITRATLAVTKPPTTTCGPLVQPRCRELPAVCIRYLLLNPRSQQLSSQLANSSPQHLPKL